LSNGNGATKNAGVENVTPSKMQEWKRRDWKRRHRRARVENARVEMNDVSCIHIRNGHLLRFLLAVSHSVDAHAGAFRQTDDSSSRNGGEDAETEAPTATVTTSSPPEPFLDSTKDHNIKHLL